MVFSVSWTMTAWFALCSASLISRLRFSITPWAVRSFDSNSRHYFSFCSHSIYKAFMRSVWKPRVASLSILQLLRTINSSFYLSTFSLWMLFIVSKVRISCNARSYFACRSLCKLWSPLSLDSNYSLNWTSSSWVFWVRTISYSSFIRSVCSSSNCFIKMLFWTE